MRYFKLLVMLAAALLPFAGSAQDQHAEVTPAPLQVQGDSVKFTATITMPKDRVFRHEGTYIVRPELGDKQFDPIKIPSSELENAEDNGFTVTVRGSALFDEDMIGNDLEIEHEYVYKDGRRKEEFHDMDDLAECCATTGTLFSLNGQYELKTFEYTPASSVPLKVVAQINFPVDIATFPVNEYQDQVAVIGDYLKAYPGASVTIRGFASPEGPVEQNRELARQRAQVAKEWLTKALDKNGYGQYLDEASIQVETTSEDWKGLVQLVRNSDMPQEKKTEVLDAVSTTESLDKLEDKLHKIVKNEDSVEHLMRPLRRATIVASSANAFREGYTTQQIDSVNRKFDEGEISASALGDIYSQEEFLQAYVRNDAATGKLTLLTAYMATYPDDLKVYSDLGALTAVDFDKLDIVGGDDALVGLGFDRDLVDVDGEIDVDRDKVKFKYKYKEEDVKDPEKLKVKMKADLKEAEGLLVKAYEANPTDAVALNNLGAYYLTVGEYEKAKKYLDQSANIKDSEGTNYNLGVYYARVGDYEKAKEHFMKAENVEGIAYNRGLAKLMTGDAAGAVEDLHQFAQAHPDYAIGHYVTAIAAAEANDERLMQRELELAVNRDSRLADLAQEDLEFQMYWDDDTFQEATDDNVDRLATDESDDDDQ